jgi:hypothetical protein
MQYDSGVGSTNGQPRSTVLLHFGDLSAKGFCKEHRLTEFCLADFQTDRCTETALLFLERQTTRIASLFTAANNGRNRLLKICKE